MTAYIDPNRAMIHAAKRRDAAKRFFKQRAARQTDAAGRPLCTYEAEQIAAQLLTEWEATGDVARSFQC